MTDSGLQMLSALVIRALNCICVVADCFNTAVNNTSLHIKTMMHFRGKRHSQNNDIIVHHECCLKHSLFSVVHYSFCSGAEVFQLFLCMCDCFVIVCDCSSVRAYGFAEQTERRACSYKYISEWVGGDCPLDFTSLNTEECTKTSGSIQRCSFLKVYFIWVEHSFALQWWVFFFFKKALLCHSLEIVRNR